MSAAWLAPLAIFGASAAQGASITASVRSPEVSLDELFLITLEIRGEEIGDPQLPVTPDIGFTPAPSVQRSSRNISIVNGQISSESIVALG
ncbi:MAG: hypothetical protein HYZ00_02800 [Candidatus Hydrogenedentes bacterium]|nr:hypothetical protein [Candidatus Hydrogenedentota bacterium]